MSSGTLAGPSSPTPLGRERRRDAPYERLDDGGAEARAALGIPSLREYSAQADAEARAKRQAEKKGGLLASLSRDLGGTIGSFFSQSEAAPERPTIGRPYNFRREDGAGPGLSGFFEDHRDSIEAYSKNNAAANNNNSAPDSAAEQSSTNVSEEHGSSRGLVAPRPPTRRGNRTSLGVTVPNAISPIGEAHMPRDPARDESPEVIESFGTTTVIHATPPTTGDSTSRTRNFGWPGFGGNGNNGDGKKGLVNQVFNLSPAKITAMFWVSAICAQASYTVVIVCCSILAYNSNEEEQYDQGALRGLGISLIAFLIFGLLFVACYARRISNRTIMKFQGPRIQAFILDATSDQIMYWLLVAFAELSYTSTVAAVTTIAAGSSYNQDASVDVLIWLILSVLFFVTFSFAFAMLHARRTSTRIVRGHRSQQRGDDLIELQPMGTRNFSRPTNEPMHLAYELEAAVGRDNQNNQNLPTPATLPSIYSQQVLVTRSRNPNIRTAVPAYNDLTEDLDRAEQRFAQNDEVDTSGISVAISDSLVGHCDESSPTHSFSSGLTYHSGRSDIHELDSSKKRVSPTSKSSSTPGSAPQLDSDYGSVLSAERMSIISLPAAVKLYLPHSSAVADLSSDDQSMPSSPVRTPHTKANTSPQIISSSPFDFHGATSSVSAHHAADFSIPQAIERDLSQASIPQPMMKRNLSQASLGRRDEALGSHPVSTQFHEPDYNAGKFVHTPRSSDACMYDGDLDTSSRPYSTAAVHPRDTNFGFYAMTPIEERSESGTARSSMRTASCRISRISRD
ncbi:hypothetical protein G7054_g13420 [Neopestalotiopsis clavispora]|nr:hypothetical protein G7054_g13420 [Neopestalotiopsis clavispora]